MFNICLNIQMILVTSVNSEMTACVSWVLERERRALEKDEKKIFFNGWYFITFIWNTTQIFIWGLVNKLLISFCSVNIVIKKVCRKHRIQSACYLKMPRVMAVLCLLRIHPSYVDPKVEEKITGKGYYIWTGKHLHQKWLWNNQSFW